ncbi:HDIG domain-containing protein [Prochlorococcus marinus XMU1414]|uniref:HDIG domain-containing protein n=1 Tax=Prochlorococcus marinus XMU1424 TaxID=2774497 RepID=A0A9D9BZ64_PROMR|nr:HDIG domain-containing metalloprotein [Prochlorococcus marinus]MBO8228406.1 HDIG domain-containing protein [Prochlorococcus marinus XMU1414]MBW3045895.1 phosphodiesterase [Prochlorococcus marinus str. MU1414]MCR8531823.1 HDIG domain-containing protein [Prochlorococcus marinus XMU1420]MCR8536269.1 HDIG domain-containing protein [Prochlorococcus marinus XMU1424]
MQNIITTLKKLFYLWRRSQVPVKQPIKISRIDNLIIFLVCILISIISSYKLLLISPLNIADIFSWFLTFIEILISSGVLILVSKKENPTISSRQIFLIITLLLAVQVTKLALASTISPLSMIIPPALIISQGMGTITALAWVSIASLIWPDPEIVINNNLFFILLVCASIVSLLGGRIRSRAQLLQLSIFVPIGSFFSQWILIGKDKISLINSKQDFVLANGDIFSDSLLLAIAMLFTILFIPIFESIFGLLTKARLLELADKEKPLIRRLSLEAPGTFEHTLLICGLAEEATRMIGGDIDLIKTGALYHDVGKLHAPNWFIENQDGSKNPHDELDDPIKSAEVLQAHVDEGLKFARKNRLPKLIANFIPEHQGTLKMGYFFQKAKEKNLDINEYHFRYKGPIPQSKETAILMLADGCEAALRAMNINASDKEALKTISNIIYSRKKDGQLDHSNLSKGEIFLIKRAFLNVWKRIRHRRIQYPTGKNNTFS